MRVSLSDKTEVNAGVSLLGMEGVNMWDVSGEGGERMGCSVVCAQVCVDTNESECLLAQISHTYFLLRKSYRATQTLYSSRTNTHFTNTERTAVTVSPVLSRIAVCPFYS